MTTTIENKQKSEKEELKEYTWSENLELERHAEDIELVKNEAIEAVKKTAKGYFVNLVTHQNHGHPKKYLNDFLKKQFDDKIKIEYVDQCGCGGYVTRVHIKK